MKRKEISDAWMREYMGPTSSGIGDGIMHSSLTFCGALEKFTIRYLSIGIMKPEQRYQVNKSHLDKFALG